MSGCAWPAFAPITWWPFQRCSPSTGGGRTRYRATGGGWRRVTCSFWSAFGAWLRSKCSARSTAAAPDGIVTTLVWRVKAETPGPLRAYWQLPSAGPRCGCYATPGPGSSEQRSCANYCCRAPCICGPSDGDNGCLDLCFRDRLSHRVPVRPLAASLQLLWIRRRRIRWRGLSGLPRIWPRTVGRPGGGVALAVARDFFAAARAELIVARRHDRTRSSCRRRAPLPEDYRVEPLSPAALFRASGREVFL